mmetsp:Transcript_46909/g.147012  ORF Transcript_46909/g.147012 Transcript_46909/m.147012 type:complete len:267 (+) Transcript_46909:349-1149(+)
MDNLCHLFLRELGDGRVVAERVLGSSDVAQHHLVALGSTVGEERGGPDRSQGTDTHAAGDEVSEPEEPLAEARSLFANLVLEALLGVGESDGVDARVVDLFKGLALRHKLGEHAHGSMSRSSHGHSLGPNLLGTLGGRKLGDVSPILSLGDGLNLPAGPQAISELLLGSLGETDKTLPEGAESPSLVGWQLRVIVFPGLLGPLRLADDASLDQAWGHAEVLERVDLLEGRGHGELGGVTRVHSRHEGVDHLLEHCLAKVSLDEVLH